MDNLRLILILLGLVILAAIVLLHRPKGQSLPNHARWRQDRREPSLGGSTKTDPETASDADSAAEEPPSFGQFSLPAIDKEAKRNRPETPQVDRRTGVSGASETDHATPRAADPDKIITLYIRRREGRRIGGSDLLDAAVKAGLSFGEMNIFHRRQEGVDKPVFSMANLTPPGHFDASAWNVFDTPGVALFATLPGPLSALDAWDAMLATGTRIAELLDADLLDEAKCRLTRQRIAQLREEMREFDRVNGPSVR